MRISENEQIKVSICSLTYNQVNYVRDTIEGFLMQKTTFPIEIIIHDDASNDGTAEIIREYADKHPDLITAIIQEENQFSKGNKPFTNHLLPRARGKYIAYCEGDDFWTDPLKLQKQFDFLENHEEYILCTHNHSTIYVETNEVTDKVKFNHNFSYDLSIYFDDWFTPTLTCFYRNIFRDYNYLAKENILTDFFLFFELLKHGKGYFMADNMATYRVHNKGVCSGLSQEQKILNHILMTRHIYKHYPWFFQIRKQIARYYLNHFNFTLRILKRKWPVWNDLANYYKYETGLLRMAKNTFAGIPYYLLRYWLPNILFFRKQK